VRAEVASEQELLERALAIAGKTLGELCEAQGLECPSELKRA
jgi:DNA mismatch repair protein MutH